jgi:predicted nucleic acid-binding Zn ribbon protein
MNPGLRARVIAEWRGLPETVFPKDTSRPVGEEIRKFLGKLGIQHRVDQQEILSLWKEVVGEFLAQHSSPAQLTEGVLIVRVLQPTVHFELERVWKRVLLEKLQARFGPRTVRKIRFQLG